MIEFLSSPVGFFINDGRREGKKPHQRSYQSTFGTLVYYALLAFGLLYVAQLGVRMYHFENDRLQTVWGLNPFDETTAA